MAEITENEAYIYAATHNLYGEVMRRIHGRVLMRPSDIKAVYQILDILYTNANLPIEVTGRDHKLTEDEEKKLLEAMTDKPEETTKTSLQAGIGNTGWVGEQK